MKRPDPMDIEVWGAEDCTSKEVDTIVSIAERWREYAFHLERSIKAMEAAGQFSVRELVWYSSVRAKGRRPAIVRGVKGRRVLVSVPGPGGKSRTTLVAPASLRVCLDLGEWRRLASAMGLSE